MYSTNDRDSLNLFNISSWFFRPISGETASSQPDAYHGADIPFKNRSELNSYDKFGAEI